MSLFAPATAESRRKLIYGASTCALVVFVGLGVFAKNGWLPHTDPLSGKKTGWFGKELPKNAVSTWNPLAAPLSTPQLSKENIYSGQRLLAVEDSNAYPTQPATTTTSVSGRVTTASGQSISGAFVTLDDRAGHTFTARTSTFGFYTISSVPTGIGYVATATSRINNFNPKVLNVGDTVSNFNFVANP